MPGKSLLFRLSPLLGIFGSLAAPLHGENPPSPSPLEQASQTFSSGDYSKALRQIQAGVQGLDPFQKSVSPTATNLPSVELREDDPQILKGHCLFAMGAYSFLSGQEDQAEASWVMARDTLAASDPSKNTFGRRATAATAFLQIKKGTNFGDSLRALDTASHAIREEPLPPESELFPNQQKLELLLITTDSVFTGVRDLASSDPSAINNLVTKQCLTFISDQALCRLLTTTKSSSIAYEQVVDQLLFGAAYNDTASKLIAQVDEICRSAPVSIRGSAMALALLWGTQLSPDQLNSLQQGMPALESSSAFDFSQQFDIVIHLAATSGDTSAVKTLAFLLKSYESPLLLLSPSQKADLCNLVSGQADPALLLRLLNSAATAKPDAPTLQEIQMAKLRICAASNRGKDAISIGEALLQGNPTPSPEIFYLLGISYAKAEQPVEATKNLTEYVNRSGNDTHLPPTLELLGKLYLNQGQKAEAIVVFQQLTQIFPNTPEAQRSRSLLASLSSQAAAPQ